MPERGQAGITPPLGMELDSDGSAAAFPHRCRSETGADRAMADA
jgi:hypothetical protein